MNKRRKDSRDKERTSSVQPGLSEVLLEEVQQRNLVMFPRLWTSDAVSLVGINLEIKKTKRKPPTSNHQ